MSAHLLPEVRFTAVLQPHGDPAGCPVSLPVFARSPSAAAKVAQQAFPIGLRRLLAIRDGARVVWEPPDHGPTVADECVDDSM